MSSTSASSKKRTSNASQKKETYKRAKNDPSLTKDHLATKDSKVGRKEKLTDQVDDQEWTEFQKLISKEIQISHQIADADEEELQKDRDEMQEREQEGFLKRLERLKEFASKVRESRESKMVITTKSKNKNIDDDKDKDDESEEDEDEDKDEMYENEWRAQKVL